MVRNCCRGSFAWTAFLARALVSWSDFVPLSVLSPYFFDFSFFQESSSVLYSAGCHQVASCCDPGGGKPQGFRFLAVGSSISVGYAVLLGPCDRSAVLVGVWKAAPFAFLLSQSVAMRNPTCLLGFGLSIFGMEWLKNHIFLRPSLFLGHELVCLVFRVFSTSFPCLYGIITGGLSCSLV